MDKTGGTNPYAVAAVVSVFAVVVAVVEGAAPNGLIGFLIGLSLSATLAIAPRRSRIEALWAQHRGRAIAGAAVSLWCLYAGVFETRDAQSGGWGFVFGILWPWLTYWMLRLLWLVKKGEL